MLRASLTSSTTPSASSPRTCSACPSSRRGLDPRDPSRFADTDALWTDVLTRGARTPSFRLVRKGATLPAAAYCRTAGVGNRTITDVIQPNRVLELYADGATMVLQGLQLTDPVARPVRQQPRPRPRPPGASQRLPLAGRGTRARAALRLPRRLRGAAGGSQEVAGLGAAAAHRDPIRGPEDPSAHARRAR